MFLPKTDSDWQRVRFLAVLAATFDASHRATACTTVAVGRNASDDGSTMCTHNADCLDCDFRLGRVPARDWPDGAMRPVVKFRAEYPRTVTEERGMTWTPENLDKGLAQHEIWMSDAWREEMILGYIPQPAPLAHGRASCNSSPG
ncbi:unnamed protein product [Discosporangium mesarthrocarpum]